MIYKNGKGRLFSTEDVENFSVEEVELMELLK
jgi:hypothetical protein